MLAAIAAVGSIGVVIGLRRLLTLGRLIPVEQLERANVGAAPIVFLIVLTVMTGTDSGLGRVAPRRAGPRSRPDFARTARRAKPSASARSSSSVEVGAAVVLLLAAGLLLQSAARLIAVDPGFRSENVITFQVGLPMNRYMEPQTRVRFIESVVDKLARCPASAPRHQARIRRWDRCARRAASRLPASRCRSRAPSRSRSICRPDRPTPTVMGLRVIDGRWITERDRLDAPPVVVISESFAKQHFPGERAIGQRLQYYSGRPTGPPAPAPEIVGVVSDVRQFGMAEREAPQMYVPHAQRAWTFTSFFVRAAGDPRSVMASLPAAVHAIDPDRPLERVRTHRRVDQRLNRGSARLERTAADCGGGGPADLHDRRLRRYRRDDRGATT